MYITVVEQSHAASVVAGVEFSSPPHPARPERTTANPRSRRAPTQSLNGSVLARMLARTTPMIRTSTRLTMTRLSASPRNKPRAQGERDSRDSTSRESHVPVPMPMQTHPHAVRKARVSLLVCSASMSKATSPNVTTPRNPVADSQKQPSP